jgi:hypothetical protein
MSLVILAVNEIEGMQNNPQLEQQTFFSRLKASTRKRNNSIAVQRR